LNCRARSGIAAIALAIFVVHDLNFGKFLRQSAIRLEPSEGRKYCALKEKAGADGVIQSDRPLELLAGFKPGRKSASGQNRKARPATALLRLSWR